MSDSNAFEQPRDYLEISPELNQDQRQIIAFLDGYLLERGTPEIRARLHAAFPFLDALDDVELRRVT